jgi:sterol desaturase/sphingolipid hydroxylase (fatty acid hydroxylase superfamily)
MTDRLRAVFLFLKYFCTMFDFRSQELIIFLATPLYIGFILFEIVLGNLHGKKWYSVKDTLQNIYLMVLNSIIDIAIRGIYVLVLIYCWERKWIEISNPVLYWIALLIGIDFLFYWMHRLEHSVRLFWAVHVTHHSSEKFNFTVGFRSSVFQPLYRFVFFIPLAFLGFRAVDIALVFSASQIWGILVHTEMVGKLGWLEKIFVTPSLHRVHHASNPLYLDKNMGMFLIVWDKLFGTFQEELPAHEYQPVKYGLTTNRHLEMPLDVVLHEWKEMMADCQKDISVSDKMGYLFGPPGWSHDGSKMTSEELRNAEKNGLININPSVVSVTSS